MKKIIASALTVSVLTGSSLAFLSTSNTVYGKESQVINPYLNVKEKVSREDINFMDSEIDSETLEMIADQLEMQGALDYFDNIKNIIKGKNNMSSNNSQPYAVQTYNLPDGGYKFFSVYHGSQYVSSQYSIHFSPSQTQRLLSTISVPDTEPLEVFLSAFSLVSPYCNIPQLISAFLSSSAIFYTCNLVNNYLTQSKINALKGKASEQISIVESGGRKVVVWVPWKEYPTVNIDTGYIKDLKVVNTKPY